jgi:hypothetical protein
VAGERLVVVAGGLDADDHQLGVELGPRCGDQPLQPGQPGTVSDQPRAVDHDLPEQRAGNHQPGRLGDIDPTSTTRCGSIRAPAPATQLPAGPQCGHHASSTDPFLPGCSP